VSADARKPVVAETSAAPAADLGLIEGFPVVQAFFIRPQTAEKRVCSGRCKAFYVSPRRC